MRRLLLVCLTALPCFPSAAHAAAPHLHRDRFPTGPSAAAAAAAAMPMGLPSRWCGDEQRHDLPSPASAQQIKVLYALPAGQHDRLTQRADGLQRAAAMLARQVAVESGMTRTVRFDLGSSCGPRYLDITTVRLPRPARSYADDFGAQDLLGDIYTQGSRLYAGSGFYPDANWVAYVEGVDTKVWGVSETPQTVGDMRHGGRAAAVVGRGARWSRYQDAMLNIPIALAHETLHLLGAVQPGAPHATRWGHCVDEWDIMCYNDAETEQGFRLLKDRIRRPCAKRMDLPFSQRLDCGGDDYFNPAPEPGSWLSTSGMNVYDSPFLADCSEQQAACGPTPAAGRGR